MKRTLVAMCLASAFGVACADTHPTGVPALSSNVGAAYTIYLDFAGFNFTGSWGQGSGLTPGSTPAYFGVTSSFNAAQQLAIKQAFARVADNYSIFNVNVTTVDPAVAAGQASTDALRQAYYDSVAKLTHSVIGGNGTWAGGGGISYVGVAQNSYGTSGNGGAGYGYHTNWIFAAEAPNMLGFVAEATAHEDGHTLSLYHQSDGGPGVINNVYSTNNMDEGNGSFAPIMGAAYYSQRGLWRVGVSAGSNNNSSSEYTQNDVAVILSNSGIGGYTQDGIGHTMATATALALTGTNVNYNLAKGVITPTSVSNPNPIGQSNYTTDFYSFHTKGGSVTLTCNDGTEYITPGVADPGGMLMSDLYIFNSAGTKIGTATLDSSTMFETFTGTLAAGNYYAEVADVGGVTSTFDTSAHYFTPGSYFLTGSGFSPVPEPASIAALAIGLGALLRRRRTRV